MPTKDPIQDITSVFQALPKDLIIYLLFQLSPKDLGRICQASGYIKNIVQDNTMLAKKLVRPNTRGGFLGHHPGRSHSTYFSSHPLEEFIKKLFGEPLSFQALELVLGSDKEKIKKGNEILLQECKPNFFTCFTLPNFYLGTEAWQYCEVRLLKLARDLVKRGIEEIEDPQQKAFLLLFLANVESMRRGSVIQDFTESFDGEPALISSGLEVDEMLAIEHVQAAVKLLSSSTDQDREDLLNNEQVLLALACGTGSFALLSYFSYQQILKINPEQLKAMCFCANLNELLLALNNNSSVNIYKALDEILKLQPEYIQLAATLLLNGEAINSNCISKILTINPEIVTLLAQFQHKLCCQVNLGFTLQNLIDLSYSDKSDDLFDKLIVLLMPSEITNHKSVIPVNVIRVILAAAQNDLNGNTLESLLSLDDEVIQILKMQDDSVVKHILDVVDFSKLHEAFERYGADNFAKFIKDENIAQLSGQVQVIPGYQPH